jgi:TRAP-type C4-dicarboxylate transport system substrate-binding protein
VIPNPVFLESFKAFKANPVPMPFAELYGALEAKAVDGQENPFAVIQSNKFYEVNKFVSATNHVYAANIVLVSKRFWDKLSPAEQKAMHEAANETRGYQRQVSRAAAQKAVGDLQSKGMQYNAIAPAEQARMRTIVKPVTDKFAASYDAGIVKLYNEQLAQVRK